MSIPATRIDCPEDIFKRKNLHDFSFDFNMNVYVCNNDNTIFTLSEILTIFDIFYRSYGLNMPRVSISLDIDWFFNVIASKTRKKKKNIAIVKYDTNLKEFITLLVRKITIILKKFNYTIKIEVALMCLRVRNSN